MDLFQFRNLSAVPGVVHAISGRAGGVSRDQYATLNVSYSVGDAPENVDENLSRIAEAVGTRRERLFAAYQIHSRGVTVVDGQTPPRPRCDVLISRSPERTLLLRFADCVPVLLADPITRSVAAVHAGWRGSAVRAAAAAVEALHEAFGAEPADLIAGIGPSIGPCCYTVGQEVVQAFADRPLLLTKGRLNLWEANRLALLDAGVDQVEVAGICTQCHADRYFSHRANGGQLAGRFAAVIRTECRPQC